MSLRSGMRRPPRQRSGSSCCATSSRDVTLTKREMVIEVRIRWRTEALTEVTVPRPKVVADARRRDAQVVARVRALAPTHTATQIALLAGYFYRRS
jgi:hypothetical protein